MKAEPLVARPNFGRFLFYICFNYTSLLIRYCGKKLLYSFCFAAQIKIAEKRFNSRGGVVFGVCGAFWRMAHLSVSAALELRRFLLGEHVLNFGVSLSLRLCAHILNAFAVQLVHRPVCFANQRLAHKNFIYAIAYEG